MKFVFGIIVGVIMSATMAANAGWLSSGIGGAVGAHMATSGIEGKVDSINFRLDALTKAIDGVKVCK